MKNIIVLCLVGIIVMPSKTFAWGRKGHGLVAEIAFSLTDSATKQQVQKYLGSTTIEQASTWMDDVRSDHQYDYMKSWHYINIDKGTVYTETTGDNIINALNKSITALEHRDGMSNDDIKKNLMIIFHLVGDLHMPLHVGYSQDKGGNDIKVNYLGKESNLHRVWDTDIIESENITLNDCLLRLSRYDKNEVEQLRNINIEEWTHEPRALLYNVYDFKNNDIDQVYVNRNKEVVENQLLLAGIRLSAVLKEIFKS